MLLTTRAALEALAAITLIQPALTSRIRAKAEHGLVHQLRKRQASATFVTDTSITSASMSIPATAAVTTYTEITPSPSASPIPITSQSQVVTTYIPILTLCPLSRSGAAISTAPYGNYTAAPYKNVTAITENGCVVEFQASRTTVCDTTLKGIATQYHVTDCDQEITFSSIYGYSLSTIAPTDTTETGPAPTIETVTTYFQAPWQSLTDGNTPSDITQRICSPVETSSQQCVDIQEVWSTVPVSATRTTTSHVDITTTITGPTVVSIETIHIDVTGTITVISISTELVSEYSTEAISTMKSTVGVITATTAARSQITTPPVTSTVTVFPAGDDGSSSADADDADTTRTTTLQVTSTIYRTSTSTMTTPSPVPTPVEDDAAGGVKGFFARIFLV